VRLFADIALVGLLPAFTIGRIGCTVVSDHIGAIVEPDRWYAFLAMDYPSEMLGKAAPSTMMKAWNLGLVEFLYLVPVNLLVLWLAFRPDKRMPAGLIAVLTALLYAPVRFFLDFLRPEKTDPRYASLTFAQWSSILAFGVALYAASRLLKSGAAAKTVTRTSREAHQKLMQLFHDGAQAHKTAEAEKRAEADRKQAAIAQARAERDREDAELASAERAKAAAAGAARADDRDDADGAPAAETAGGKTSASAKPAGSQPAARPANRPASNKSGGAKKRKR
jgi:hypothetical protein